jgi:hypothetical protein
VEEGVECGEGAGEGLVVGCVDLEIELVKEYFRLSGVRE